MRWQMGRRSENIEDRRGMSPGMGRGIRVGGADAVLAASIFHYGEFTVGQAKALLARDGIPVRL